MADEIVYDVRGLSYSYLGRFPALNKIDLTIRRGEKIALLGANGSGKSTLLLVLAGLIFAPIGSMKFLGADLKEDRFADQGFQKFFRSRVGIVFQNSDIQLFNSNVKDELLFGLTQLGLQDKEIRKRIDYYAGLMDIKHLMDRHPQYLSIGEKRRVAITSVLVMEPEVILLDEPSAGLDPRTCRHLVVALSEFVEKGRTIITATQDIHLVSEIAERAVVLREDKTIARDGRAAEVLADSAFLEEHNLVHTHLHKHSGMAHVHSHEHPAHDHSH